MKQVDEVLQERGSKYGDFSDLSLISQKLKDTVFSSINLKHKDEKLNSAIKESIEMICHKLARISNGDAYYLDSWRDMSNYAKLVVDKLEKTDGVTDVEVVNKQRINGKWETKHKG